MAKVRRSAQRRFRQVGSGTSVCLRYRLPRPTTRLPHAPRLSREAKLRLRVLEHARTHSISATCRHFGIARTTYYRWQRRYDPTRLGSLENRSSRPRQVRHPTWTGVHVAAVRQAREQHPRWGKAKLAVVLRRRGVLLSVSMVGRILTHLRQTRQLVEAPRTRLRPHSRHRRPYAVRKPKHHAVAVPCDLVQVDTMPLTPLPGVERRQFTAVDVVSRTGVVDVRSVATAGTATDFLAKLLDRMPCAVKAIQVDGGSEFMAAFEATCEARGIALFELPPRSPKLNGCVERLNRTAREEFWAWYRGDLELPALQQALQAWEHGYNHARPHQALGHLTPAAFLAAQATPQL